MKRETFLKRYNSYERPWEQTQYLLKTLNNTIKRTNSAHPDKQHGLLDEVLFLLDVGLFDRRWTAEALKNVNLSLRDTFIEKLIECKDHCQTSDATKYFSITQSLMLFWSKANVPLESPLWKVAKEVSQKSLSEQQNYSFSYNFRDKWAQVSRLKDKSKLNALKTFPMKDGMLQAAIHATDINTFNDFVAFDYSSLEWGRSVSLLLSVHTKPKNNEKLEKLFSERFLTKVEKDLKAEPLLTNKNFKALSFEGLVDIYARLEGRGCFDEALNIKSIIEQHQTINEQQLFPMFFDYLNGQTVPDEVFEKYKDLRLEQFPFVDLVTKILTFAQTSTSSFSEFAESAVKRLLDQHKDAPWIDRAAEGCLMNITRTWSNLPKFSIVDLFLSKMTEEGKKNYLAHCALDDRISLMKKVIKHVELEHLHELKNDNSWNWGETQKNFLSQKISGKEKDLLKKEVSEILTTKVSPKNKRM